MKFLVDLFPLVAFFGVYQKTDMFVATAAVMVACAIQSTGYRLFAGKFDKNHVLALALVLPFGAATLIFRDPAFIKWNGTVEMWILAAVFMGSHFVQGKPIVERMLGEAMELPTDRWRQLNLAWVVFFAISGACNIVVAYSVSEATWMSFRLFGLTSMTIVFILAQGWWMMRQLDEESEQS